MLSSSLVLEPINFNSLLFMQLWVKEPCLNFNANTLNNNMYYVILI